MGMSQTSISHTLPLSHGWNKSTVHIIHKIPLYSRRTSPNRGGFHSTAGLPKTISAIDCMHIKAPSPDLLPYLNCKQYHSINVQLICNSQNHLLTVVSHFLGGVYDSHILQNSSVGMYLKQGAAGDAWLIGMHL